MVSIQRSHPITRSKVTANISHLGDSALFGRRISSLQVNFCLWSAHTVGLTWITWPTLITRPRRTWGRDTVFGTNDATERMSHCSSIASSTGLFQPHQCNRPLEWATAQSTSNYSTKGHDTSYILALYVCWASRERLTRRRSGWCLVTTQTLVNISHLASFDSLPQSGVERRSSCLQACRLADGRPRWSLYASTPTRPGSGSERSTSSSPRSPRIRPYWNLSVRPM